MSPRTGRPKKSDPAVNRFSVCVDSAMLLRLNEYCRSECVSKGEAVRRALLLLFGLQK